MSDGAARFTGAHISETGSLEPDEDGFYWATCACGDHAGAFPDLETAVDALMAHAFDAGTEG